MDLCNICVMVPDILLIIRCISSSEWLILYRVFDIFIKFPFPLIRIESIGFTILFRATSKSLSGFIHRFSLCSILAQIIFPDNSLVILPARPARFQKSTSVNLDRPIALLKMNIFLAGKLTPSSKVEVQNR